jgi:hypothetical protein
MPLDNLTTHSISFALIYFLLATTAISQSSKLNITAFRPVSNTLSNNSIGSGFTTITFQMFAKREVKYIQVHSSNNLTKKILDSLFKDDKFYGVFKKLKIGSYCLPIFQCMKNDDLTLNWVNNNSYNIFSFGSTFILPENTYLLKPIVVFGKKT